MSKNVLECTHDSITSPARAMIDFILLLNMPENEKDRFKKLFEAKMRASESGSEPGPEEAHDAAETKEERLARLERESQLNKVHVDPEVAARARQREGMRAYKQKKE